MTLHQRDRLVLRTEYEEDDDLPFVVVSAVAAVSSASIAEVGPLNDVLDPEALCELFGSRPDGRTRAGGRIAFRLEGYLVEIDAGDRVVVVYE